MKTLTLELGEDGVALVTFDVPGRTMNTLTKDAIDDFDALVERLRSDPAIKGAILTSGKANGFCAGADLGEMWDRLGGKGGDDRAQIEADVEATFHFSKILRRLETCGKPVATALNGLAMGGGLELALATHYRVVADSEKIVLGLPEAKIGLLPGAGGTQRLPRLTGVIASLPYLLEGKNLSPNAALKLGVVHEIAPADALIDRARAWLLETGNPVQPWDAKGYAIPGGPIYSLAVVNAFSAAVAAVKARTFGNYPAQDNILRCVYEGTQLPMDTALRVEIRYFVATLRSPQAKAMVRSLFLSTQELAKGAGRPSGIPRSRIGKVGILGAGNGGAALAYQQAITGVATVLVDPDAVALKKALDSWQVNVETQIASGRLGAEAAEAILARIETTSDLSQLADAEIAIVAPGLVETVSQFVSEAGVVLVLESGGVLSDIVARSSHAYNLLGLHPAGPVKAAALIEIARTPQTSDAAIAKAMDYVLTLKKTPIVVADAPGLYVSRVSLAYVREGFEMLAEGISPALIENIGRSCGMPKGPLQMADDLGLEALRTAWGEGAPGPTRVIEGMTASGQRGKGFYETDDTGASRLSSGLAAAFPVSTGELNQAGREQLRQRFLLSQALEAARCLEAGIVARPADADVGAILGWGFPGWTGGPINLIDQMGAEAVVEQCAELAATHGARFEASETLKKMAATGDSYYIDVPAQAKAA